MFSILGPFLLTNLLLKKMKESATPKEPTRIVNVTCFSYKAGEIYFPDLNFIEKKYGFIDAYAQSKLAMVLFSLELAKRTKGRTFLAHLVFQQRV